MEECILDIKLTDGPVVGYGHSKDGANGGRFDYRTESVRVILTGVLMKPFGNQTCFVACKRAIRMSLDSINPFATDDIGAQRWLDKRPGAIFQKGSKLVTHGGAPRCRAIGNSK